MSKWEAHRIRDWPPNHFVGFADDLTPIAHDRSERRTRELCWIIGCMHPGVVHASLLRRPDGVECSCCDKS